MNLWRYGIEPAIGDAAAGNRPVEVASAPGPPPIVGAIVLGHAGVGDGGSYRPHPSLPPAQHLEYLDKGLRAGVVLVLLFWLLRDPGRVARAFKRRAGVE